MKKLRNKYCFSVTYLQLTIFVLTRSLFLSGDMSVLRIHIRFLKFLYKFTITGNDALPISLTQALSTPERSTNGLFVEVGEPDCNVLAILYPT